MSKRRKNRISRRKFLEGTGAALAVATAAPALADQRPAAAAGSAAGVPRTTIRVTVNGRTHRLEVDDRWTLVELLRDHLGLTGTKIGCDRGECGACTVLLDGTPVYSCSQLAVWTDGRSVETVEGLARGGRLDPLQEAFADHNAAQCGFCTSGQLMAAKGLLTRTPRPTASDVRAGLVGNLCRCSNYNAIVEAVLAAAATSRPSTAANSARGPSEAPGSPTRQPRWGGPPEGSPRSGPPSESERGWGPASRNGGAR